METKVDPMKNIAQDLEFKKHQESIPELLTRLANDSAALVRDEIQLVVQETRGTIKTVSVGVVMMAVGGLMGLAAFYSLCAALIIELSSFMDAALAALLVGAALALSAFLVALVGHKKIKKPIR